MALVRVTDVKVLNNPCNFTDPFQFEITFECEQELQNDIEWKIIYVGSADSEQYDQELDSVLVGPVPVGCNRIVFQAAAPDGTQIPQSELIGVTVVLLTCSYRGEEFVRVGYYVNNDYLDPAHREEPPAHVLPSMLSRSILEDAPRVTRFPIAWDQPFQPEGVLGEEDHMMAMRYEEEEETVGQEAGGTYEEEAYGEEAEEEGMMEAGGEEDIVEYCEDGALGDAPVMSGGGMMAMAAQ